MLKNNRPKGLVGAKPCPAPVGTSQFLITKARVLVLSVTRHLAEIAAVRRVAHRAELRAKVFELVAADRLESKS